MEPYPSPVCRSFQDGSTSVIKQNIANTFTFYIQNAPLETVAQSLDPIPQRDGAKVRGLEWAQCLRCSTGRVTSCRVSASRVYWIHLSSCHSDTQDSRKRPHLEELMGGRPHSSAARPLLTLQLWSSVSNTGLTVLSTSASWLSDTNCVHMQPPPLLLSRMSLPSHIELRSLQP